MDFKLKNCLFSLSRSRSRSASLLAAASVWELFRGADYILVLAPPAVQFFAPTEHPHGTKRSFFFAQHAAVVADTLVVIVTQMTLLCALSRPASPCAEFT
jgi:hypothetical protein